MESKKYFWFTNDNRELGYNDGRIARVGRTHKVSTEKLSKCEHGLHASERIIAALGFQKGNILFLVELGGVVISNSDKSLASERKYIASFNAEKLLREFARKQALINIEKIKPHTSAGGYDLIVRFLKTGDESIRSAAHSAADSAADSAARSAAHSAARSAARSAAYSAARSAAYSVAHSAAYYAAYSAARSAAYSVAYYAAEKMLREMIKDATGWDI